jgi:hypothetical protein
LYIGEGDDAWFRFVAEDVGRFGRSTWRRGGLEGVGHGAGSVLVRSAAIAYINLCPIAAQAIVVQ